MTTTVAPKPSWRDRAACLHAPAEWFFLEKGDSSRPAKALCATCQVQQDCLGYALDVRERFGIYGGMTTKERLAFRRLREGNND